MSEKELNWLKSKTGYIKIDKIEKDLGMSQGTLRKFIDGERGLADKWEEKVSEWVKKFKK